MPYIKQYKRNWFDNDINALVRKLIKEMEEDPKFKGTLNYIFTKIGKTLMSRAESEGMKFGYQEIDDVSSAMRGAATEWDRRVLATYEDEKIKENGDV